MKDRGASRWSFPKATVPTPSVAARHLPLTGGVGPRRFFRFFLIAQKETRPAGRNLCFAFRGCSACGRATFQGRKVAASSQSPLCSGHPGLGIPHAAPLLLLSNHEPLRWVHGWGPIAGLQARTQGSCAVSSAIPPGAVPSGRVSKGYHYRSP